MSWLRRIDYWEGPEETGYETRLPERSYRTLQGNGTRTGGVRTHRDHQQSLTESSRKTSVEQRCALSQVILCVIALCLVMDGWMDGLIDGGHIGRQNQKKKADVVRACNKDGGEKTTVYGQVEGTGAETWRRVWGTHKFFADKNF